MGPLNRLPLTRRSRFYPTFILTALAFSSFAWSQNVRISGTITDFAGAPIANAQVALGQGGLTATSDAQGRFTLTNSSIHIFGGKQGKSPLSGRFQSGFFNLNLDQAAKVNLDVFSPLGQRLTSQNLSLERGQHALPLPGKNGTFIYRLTAEENETSPMVLAKTAAANATAATFYDVMKVTATGYNKHETILVGSATGIDTTGMNIVLLKEGDLAKFSFFVTSLVAMRARSGNQNGFGGDLRYGFTGPGAGLRGADKICADVAEGSLKGSSAKQWRAFLSVADAGNGAKQDAIDRIGPGPWYDRLGRLVAENTASLVAADRPAADAAIAADLPNEIGEPNHTAGGVTMDNHDILTGSDRTGRHVAPTCEDWTTTTTPTGGTGGMMGRGPVAGHSWPANSGRSWVQAHAVAGCAPSVVSGQGSFGGNGVGDGGGYGGIYCFALVP